ncbi:Crp/Fnr family transcriptional regulator [Bernardetia sp. OM2101]|uniref:Crp/Fnr family transcriptional regulator n=1 Tax=Bernardetia sp. OM2101 TaxID=3344876 RepID=UPI0035D0148E
MTQENKKYYALYLEQLSHSTPEEKDFIKNHLTIQRLDKGEFFLESGEIQKEMGFICQGLIRRYFINEQGDEITTGFTKENQYITDYPAFIRQKPTKYFLQSLEPCIIIKLPYSTIQESYKKFKNSEMQGRFIAEMVLTVLSDRVESFLFNTAEERYLKFISENPELIQRVSLTHLSSFLGIKRQSLSRIRNKMSKK